MTSLHDKKMAVLQLLRQEAEPISLPVLLDKLDQDYKERTIRRWLHEMIEEGSVKKIGQKRGTKYQATQRKTQQTLSFEPDSLHVIEYIRQPLYERQPVAYNSDWFDSYAPNSSFYLAETLRKQLHHEGSRTNNKDPAGTYAHKIYHRLLIDLSYNSSRLEGNTYSLLDTERLVLSGTAAEGKLDEEKVMILNHKEAIRYLVDNAPRLEVNPQAIYTLHYLLADGLVEPKYAGKVRDHWVRITGSTYIPFEDPRKLQWQLEKIAHKAHQIVDPFEQSFFLLIHMSYLQAFSDVNKRTARLSANIPLIIHNLVPLSFSDVARDDYMSAILAIYELQDVRPMVDLFSFSYIRTCTAYDSTVKAMGFDEIRVRYRQQRRMLVREVIAQKLTGPFMIAYIESETKKEIPEHSQKAFTEDVLEDLEQMDENKIGGLGITPEQVQVWKETYRKEQEK